MKNLSTLTGSLGTVKYWWFAFNWTILSETPDLNKKISTIYILCTVPISSSPTSAAHLAAWCWINSCKLSNWCSPAAIYLSYPRTKVGGFLANMVALNRSPTRSCIDLTNTFWCPNHITKQNLHVHWWRRISICKVTSVFIPIKTVLFSSENRSRSHSRTDCDRNGHHLCCLPSGYLVRACLMWYLVVENCSKRCW